MMCTDCGIHLESWQDMKTQYKAIHPDVESPHRYFTKEAREK